MKQFFLLHFAFGLALTEAYGTFLMSTIVFFCGYEFYLFYDIIAVLFKGCVF
jgi:hypothetical protein